MHPSAVSQLCRRCSLALQKQQSPPPQLLRGVQRHPFHTHPSNSTIRRDARFARKSVPERLALAHISRSTRARSSSAAAADAVTGSLGSKFKTSDPSSTQNQRILEPDSLFHSFTNSPIPEIRRRAAYIRQNAYCPHPDHRLTRVPDTEIAVKRAAVCTNRLPPMHVDFECPDCGISVYCSKEHWMDDYHNHLEICDVLRQVNEDDHDLRSGRTFPEFEYAGPQLQEAVVNLVDWDHFFYTRNFNAINDDRSMRQATKLLTYPITLGSILHEFSPYTLRSDGRLSLEGLKSFTALRYHLHPTQAGAYSLTVQGLRPEPPAVRIFVLGARAESSLPRDAWHQLALLFPRSRLHLIFIGPESMMNRDDEFPLPPRTPSNPFGAIVEDVSHLLKISTIVDYYHTLHRAQYFQPFDIYFDCFVMFHPGLGHLTSSHEWEETLPLLLETKCPIIATGYTQYDMERDIEWVNKKAAGEFDVLLKPAENMFRSLRWDLNDQDPQDLTAGNWGVWVFRGKRYEAIHNNPIS